MKATADMIREHPAALVVKVPNPTESTRLV
jgi:hypothetical protein